MLVLAVQEVAEPLEDHLRVGLADGVEAVLHELLEQLGGVGHVEVAGEGQVPARHVVLAEEGMAVGQLVPGVRAVAEVPHVDVAEERAPALQRRVVRRCLRAPPERLLDILHHHVEDALERVVPDRPLAAQVRLARRHVELDRGDPGSVLAAVVLLLHQQVEAPEPPRGVLVPLLVVRQGPSEPDQRQPAVVLDVLAHSAPG